MTSRRMMKHRATVVRDHKEEEPGGLGQPVYSERPLHDAMPCRIWSEEGRLVVTADKIVNVRISRMIFPWGTDLQEKTDTITKVVDRRGNVLFGDTKFRVENIYPVPRRINTADLESVE